MSNSPATRPGRPPISAVVIARDEARSIERCLRSVLPFAADVVLVDSGSRDDTVRIAERLGARVFHSPWPGYGAQKRVAVGHATHDWVFSIDADEEVTPSLAAEIDSLDFSLDAYDVPRAVWYLGRWIPSRRLVPGSRGASVPSRSRRLHRRHHP